MILSRSNENKALPLVLGALIVTFAVQIPTMIVLITVLGAMYAYAARARPLTPNLVLGFCLLSLLFVPGFLKPYHGLSPMFYWFSTFMSFCLADVISKDLYALWRAFRLVYAASAVAIIIILYVYWGYPEPFGMVIQGSSTNGIPAYLIIIQIGLSLCSYLVNGRLPVLTPMFTAVVAFFGNGRGSLVIAGVMIVATFVLNLLPGGHRKGSRLGLYLTLFAAVTGVGIVYGADFFEFVTRSTKLSVGLADANRIQILDQYLGKIDAFTALFGADYSGTVIDDLYRGNPHISFIRTHSFFGLPLTFLAIISPALVFFADAPFKTKIVFSCLIGFAVLRAGSEPILFPTLLDALFFSYFFLLFKHGRPVQSQI
jgi:hypothetical protein